MTIELKIKAKHLALEPAIIRREEKKLASQIKYMMEKFGVTIVTWKMFESDHEHERKLCRLMTKLGELESHRKSKDKGSLKSEARATHIARAYLSGKSFSSCEANRKTDTESNSRLYYAILPRVNAMIQKYGRASGRSVSEVAIKYWIQHPDTIAPRK